MMRTSAGRSPQYRPCHGTGSMCKFCSTHQQVLCLLPRGIPDLLLVPQTLHNRTFALIIIALTNSALPPHADMLIAALDVVGITHDTNASNLALALIKISPHPSLPLLLHPTHVVNLNALIIDYLTMMGMSTVLLMLSTHHLSVCTCYRLGFVDTIKLSTMI